MEKKFEELIEENKVQCDYSHYGLELETVYKLLKQVREATIEECLEIADKIYFNQDGAFLQEMENLPADRILITENEE